MPAMPIRNGTRLPMQKTVSTPIAPAPIQVERPHIQRQGCSIVSATSTTVRTSINAVSRVARSGFAQRRSMKDSR